MAIDSERAEPRSRRAILAGALGGVAAVVANRFASPDRTSAAHLPGFGHANAAGGADTSLTATTAGTALLVTQSGTGTALRGSATGPGSIAGFFTAGNGTGISGVTGAPGSYGVFASNNGAAGTGGALRASGVNNHGIVATTGNNSASAIVATSTVFDGVAILARNTSGLADDFLAGSGIRALSGGGTVANIHPATGTEFADAAGEFAGPNGLIGASTGNLNTAGVLGLGGASGSGVWGRGNGGNGVFAQSVSASAVSAESDTGEGVNGYSNSNYGVRGASTDSDGIHGETDSTTAGAAGVSGTDGGGTEATSGVRGTTTSTYGSGVSGKANTSAINAAGVQGTGVGFAMGVWGTTTDMIGVYGLGTGNGTGVYGSGATGVIGASTNGWGVYAVNSSAINPALYVNGDAGVTGDVNVTGNVNKAGGTFKIDHPLDPANKFLYHSFVESPDMKNVYDGVVTTDAKGEATVKLPAWFEKLNRDFRYQLTVIGRWSEAWISSELNGNAFAIATKVPGTKVSWQVTGIRQDAWANAHRVVVEEPKPKGQKGLYLHPKENGQPASKAIGYAERKAIEAKLPK